MAKKSTSRLRDLGAPTTGPQAPRWIPGDDGGGPILGRWGFALASLLALVILTFGAIVFGTAKIEASLEDRAMQTLGAAGLAEVEAEATGRTVRLYGFVDNEDDVENVPRQMAQIDGVGGIVNELRIKVDELVVGDVAADPMTFVWANGEMIVTGTVSSDDARFGIIGALEDAVDYSLDTEGLIVREGVADESPWISAVLSALRDAALASVEGEMLINGDAGVVQVSAEFDTRQERSDMTRQVEDLLAAAPLDFVSGFTLAEAPPPPPPEQVVELQSNLDELIEGKVVEFETNSDELTDVGTALLDEILDALRMWPEVPVEIAGHADSNGTDEFNLELSTRRAQAVLTYLLERGEVSERFVVVGYGETVPIASNDTAEGRARNRRIEFIALGE